MASVRYGAHVHVHACKEGGAVCVCMQGRRNCMCMHVMKEHECKCTAAVYCKQHRIYYHSKAGSYSSPQSYTFATTCYKLFVVA